MIFSRRSARRKSTLSGLPVLLLCAGVLLMPLASGCSGKKAPKQSGKQTKKTAGKQAKGSPKKAPAKKGSAKKGDASGKPAIPAVFTRLTSYEGISLEKPFESGESEFLVKIDPVKGIRICTTERVPGGKLILDASTLQIIRLETKTQYEDEKKAAAAFEARKAALKKSLDLPPIQGGRGVTFAEMISDGRGRSLQLILSGSTVQEIVAAREMPRSFVPVGKPVHGLFGVTLGMPIPRKMVDESAMILFHPDPGRSEFSVYKYFNDEKGNVLTILAESDPEKRAYSPAEALELAMWLEEKFAMKMSYDSEGPASGVFRYSSEGRALELLLQDGKLTLSARISRPDKKK